MVPFSNLDLLSAPMPWPSRGLLPAKLTPKRALGYQKMSITSLTLDGPHPIRGCQESNPDLPITIQPATSTPPGYEGHTRTE